MPISSNVNRDQWKGKALWEKIDTISIFAIEALFFIGIFLIPVFGWISFLFIAIFVIFYGAVYYGVKEHYYRKMSEKNAGRRVIYGWIDEEEDLGEEYEFPIKSIHPFSDLPEMEKEALKEFEEYMLREAAKIVDEDKYEKISEDLKTKSKTKSKGEKK